MPMYITSFSIKVTMFFIEEMKSENKMVNYDIDFL